MAAHLLPEKLAINEIDIIFTAAKNHQSKNGHKVAYGISFDGFVHSLLLMAKSIDDAERLEIPE